MAKVLQHRRGTTAEHKNFVGAEGEITVDTDKKSILVHDGVTAGGHEILPDCLPKIGGEVTGYIQLKSGDSARIQSSVDNSHVPLIGGSSWNNGGRVVAYGKDHATYPGQVQLTATDGSTHKQLVIKPDGTFTWNSKNVITSDGGTMTGAITTSSTNSFKCATNDSQVQIYGGNGYGNGAYVNLRGKDHSTEAGVFSIAATDGTNTKILAGSPSGTLTWVGNDVITSVGGTISGDVTLVNGKYLKNSLDTGWTRILGGSTFETGGRIQLGGKNCSGYEGQVWIVPNNGTSAPALKLLPDGSATWNGKNIVRSVNNATADANGNVTVSASPTFKTTAQVKYSSGTITGQTWTKTYTTTQAGYVHVYIYGSRASGTGKVNLSVTADGVTLASHTEDYISTGSASGDAFLPKGTVITFKKGSGKNGDDTGNYSVTITPLVFA